MAITREAFELLCWTRSQAGVPWDRVLSLGRQSVDLQVWDRDLWSSLSEGSVRADEFVGRADDASAGEALFRQLGSKQVDSMDISDYEGASVAHDLNEPVSSSLHGAFDLVFDGGTLEHVFNYPLALANSLAMVKPGGWFLSFAPSNMWCGHGFYQLSAETFRAILCEDNGFRLRLLAFSVARFKSDYYVWRPEAQSPGGRLGLTAPEPTCLLIAAQRIGEVGEPPLKVQQSDYVERWEGQTSAPARSPGESAPVSERRVWHLGGRSAAAFLPWGLRGRLRWALARRRHARELQAGLTKLDSLRGVKGY